MTTARQIIAGALTHHLNRLSPGETLDADLAGMCLSALNEIADEWNGAGSFLWRDALYSAVVTGATATLGVTFTGIDPGDNILSVARTAGSGSLTLEVSWLAPYATM